MADNQPMAPTPALIDLAGLSAPVTALVNRISDAVGILYEPRRMKQVARAEIEVQHLKQEAGLVPLTDLEKRSLGRLVKEEVKKQVNMENIIEGATKLLSADADPTKMDTDWILYFFEHCRTSSSEDFQKLWSQVLGAEANRPGSISKRTVNRLSTMDRKDAEVFQKVCQVTWRFANRFEPFIDDLANPIFSGNGITFETLGHLQDIGLLSFNDLAGYQLEFKNSTSQLMITAIHPASRNVFVLSKTLPEGEMGNLPLGRCLFTSTGKEIASLVQVSDIPGYTDHCMGAWKASGWDVEHLNAHETAQANTPA